MARTPDDIRRDLRAVGRRLSTVPDLHRRKLDLFREGKAAGMMLREMGEAVGVSESAVIKALSRDDASAKT